MKENKNKVIAICYDFDKTLGPKEVCWAYGFFEKMGITEDDFWKERASLKSLEKMEQILSFLYFSIYKTKQLGIPFKKEDIEEIGKDLYYYNGVETWFDRINKYAESQGYTVEHYIISAGLKEVLSNCSIAKHFKKIYACSYVYDEDNNPIWPANLVNSTEKTQYLYRIKKNILKENDPRVNEKFDEDRVPFENMIYVGDSLTDIPCMSIVVKNGGTSIGVYDDLPAKKELMLDLFNKNRINNYCPADYSEGSEIETVVKKTIDKIKLNDQIKDINNDMQKINESTLNL